MTDLITQLDEGYTGLVAYSDEGYTISPLTHDSHTVLAQIQHLSPEVMPTLGKNAAAGVKEAIVLLEQSSFSFGDIVLVTSGISETEKMNIERLLAGTNYVLSSLAISTTEGALLYDEQGQVRTNSNGQAAVSRLVPERLHQLATQSGGIALTYQYSHDDVDQLQVYLQKMRSIEERREQSGSLAAQSINEGYWLLWPLAGMLLFAFRRGVIWSVGLLLILPVSQADAGGFLERWQNADRQGYQHFRHKNYNDAAELFEDPAWLGAALYELGDYQGAVAAFSRITDGSSDYNLANALAKLGQFEEAAGKYRAVLERNPEHYWALSNLELIEDILAVQEQEELGTEGGEDHSDEQEEGEGDEESGDSSQADESGCDDNVESDPDTENVPELQGDSETAAANDALGNGSQDPQPSDREEGGEPSPQQQSGRSGEYDSDRFGTSYFDQDVGTPSEEELEAMRHQLSELGEANPVLNRLSQIQVDRTLLLRNLLRLQAERKQPAGQTDIEW